MNPIDGVWNRLTSCPKRSRGKWLMRQKSSGEKVKTVFIYTSNTWRLDTKCCYFFLLSCENKNSLLWLLFSYLNQHQSYTLFFLNCDHSFNSPTRSKVPQMVSLPSNYWTHRSVYKITLFCNIIKYKKENSLRSL